MRSVLCPICYEDCYDPIHTRCGHAFCRPCLVQWTEDGQKTCPSCRRYITAPKSTPVVATPSLGRYVAIHFLLTFHWLNPYGIRLSYYLGCHGFGLVALMYIMVWSGRYSTRLFWDLVTDAILVLITASIIIQLSWSVSLYYTLDWIALAFCVGFFFQVLWHRFVCPIRVNPFENYGHTKPVQAMRRTLQAT
ncbi:hypothetical protein LEN26_019767 [Aphanomyces euteiches]|nr:hypothetical protein LEN26_019767 [Aphanomyces euteiches]